MSPSAYIVVWFILTITEVTIVCEKIIKDTFYLKNFVISDVFLYAKKCLS